MCIYKYNSIYPEMGLFRKVMIETTGAHIETEYYL